MDVDFASPAPVDEYVVDSTGIPKRMGSKEEGYIANALHRYDVTFYYQYEVLGGWAPGGMVLDFLLPEQWMIIEYYGPHWHTGSLGADDEERRGRILEYFQGAIEIKEWTEREVYDQESANRMVLSIL